MDQPHSLVTIVTVAALLTYIWMALRVAFYRQTCGVAAPAMTGDDGLERRIRVQANTLEWLPLFLTGLWLFALTWNDRVAALLGVVWILGRIIYAVGYTAAPLKRAPGFVIQLVATMALLLGALGRAVYIFATTGN